MTDSDREKRYRAFDRYEKLGEPPWSGPELEAWEKAHGHDARLKCYPEFGCLVSYVEIEEHDRLQERAQELERERDEAVAAARDFAEALFHLHDEVEMAEATGVCLPNRVASLRAGDALARHPSFLPPDREE